MYMIAHDSVRVCISSLHQQQRPDPHASSSGKQATGATQAKRIYRTLRPFPTPVLFQPYIPGKERFTVLNLVRTWQQKSDCASVLPSLIAF